MKRLTAVCAVLGILSAPCGTPGHICDNIFRQANKLIIKPEVSNLIIDKEASFKIYMQCNMRIVYIAEQVKLLGNSRAFDIKVDPVDGHWVRPGNRYEYNVKLSLKPGFKSGNYPINFVAMVGNRRLRSYTLDMTLEEKMPVRSLQKIPIFSDELPLIDGQLTEKCWKNALRLQTLLNTENEKPVLPAGAFFTSDAKNIYIAMAVRVNGRQTEGQSVLRSITAKDEKDEKLHSIKDCFMVLFAPPEKQEIYILNVTNSGKIKFSSFHEGKEKILDVTRSGVKVALNKTNAMWYAELCVPVAAMGAQSELKGKTWRINIVREYGETPLETSFWSGTAENYLESQTFGEVVFSP